MTFRLFSVGVLSLYVAGLFAMPAGAAGPYDDAYQFLRQSGAIGSADTSRADEVISRAEVLRVALDSRIELRNQVEKMRGRLSSLPLFLDVEPTAWYAPYAEVAFRARVTSGLPNRTLKPEEAIPSEEAITLALRAYRQQGEPGADDTEWFAPFLRAALAKNLLARPRDMMVGRPIRRGEFYDLVYRLAVIERDHLETFSEAKETPEEMPKAKSQMPEVKSQIPNTKSQIPEAKSPMPDTGSQNSSTSGAPIVTAQPSTDAEEIRQFASTLDFAITIPTLGIKDLRIIHPADANTGKGLLAVLKDGVGHLFAYPAQGGKIMVYGHSSGYSWDVSAYSTIFTQVNRLQPGDKVYVTYDGNLYVYAVTGQQTIAPDDATPFMGTGEELILYTCWPVGSNKSRLIVRAVPAHVFDVR